MAKKKAKAAEVAEPEEEVAGQSPAEPEVEAETVPKGQLGDWRDKIPEPVQKATDQYVAQLRAYNASKAEKDAAKSNCLAVMDEYGIDSVPIDEGGKRLVRFSEMKLKTAKAENEGEG